MSIESIKERAQQVPLDAMQVYDMCTPLIQALNVAAANYRPGEKTVRFARILENHYLPFVYLTTTSEILANILYKEQLKRFIEEAFQTPEEEKRSQLIWKCAEGMAEHNRMFEADINTIVEPDAVLAQVENDLRRYVADQYGRENRHFGYAKSFLIAFREAYSLHENE